MKIGMGEFGKLSNSLDRNRGDDGDKGSCFPRSDAADLGNGASFIPGCVTLARHLGRKVQFRQPCLNQCCWFWQLADGSRIYHYEEMAHKKLKTLNDGVCQSCGNDFISGGTMTPEQARTHQQKGAVPDT
ncbi:MAG: hypothetical protein ABI643_02185 [Candidatus Doudnabacteria bacterium]